MATGQLTGTPRATGPDEARRRNAGPRGRPKRHTTGHNHGTRPGAKQLRLSGAENLEDTHQPRSAGHLPRLEPTHQHTHPTTQPGKKTSGAANTRSQAHAPTPHTPARIGGVQAQGGHQHTQPNTPARNGRVKAKPEPKHTHQKPEPGMAGCSQNGEPKTRTADPS